MTDCKHEWEYSIGHPDTDEGVLCRHCSNCRETETMDAEKADSYMLSLIWAGLEPQMSKSRSISSIPHWSYHNPRPEPTPAQKANIERMKAMCYGSSNLYGERSELNSKYYTIDRSGFNPVVKPKKDDLDGFIGVYKEGVPGKQWIFDAGQWALRTPKSKKDD